MKTYLKTFFILLVSLLIFSNLKLYAQDVDRSKSLLELQDTIQKILIEKKIPGAGIAIISDNKVILQKGIGKADVKNDINVNVNTMFRLGSVSKLFVGLAILKLQEEGLINLKDKVKDIIPEIEIKNPWDAEFPIRIENLLEHTSGLDDWSFAELGCDKHVPNTLKEVLEFYPKARVARFVPGTRIEYSNLGVSIAAYAVEKVSGMSYENYIDKYFFKPIGVEYMTFRNSDKYRKDGAKGYIDGIETPYWKFLYRPSGSLFGTTADMVKILKFFINRGKVDDNQIISDSSLLRMERNESLHIEKFYVFKGNCLTNSASYYGDFVYFGHGGNVAGSCSDFCYLPKYNSGYVIMINGENQNTIDLISRLIKKFQTKNLPHEISKTKKASQKSKSDYTGYYIPVKYKFNGALKFLKKIKGIKKVWHENDTLCLKSAFAQSIYKFCPNGNNEFRHEYSDKIKIFQTNDPVEGKVIYGSIGMLKKVSRAYAYTLIFIFYAFLIVPITTTFFILIKLINYLFSKKRNKVTLWICLNPFINILIPIFLLFVFLSFIQTKIDAFLLLGNMSFLSVLLFIGTITYAVYSLWSIYYIYKNRGVKMSKILYYHSILASVFNLIFTIYFFSNGLIGIITWI